MSFFFPSPVSLERERQRLLQGERRKRKKALKFPIFLITALCLLHGPHGHQGSFECLNQSLNIFSYPSFRDLFNIYFYLLLSQTMVASSKTYEKGFHQQHQEVLEENLSGEQVPLQSYQVVQ